jgi:hypothetical protein
MKQHLRFINQTAVLALSISFGFIPLEEKVSYSAELACSTATTLESLVKCITTQMPQSNSNDFVPASQTETQDWRSMVRQMLQGQCESISVPSSLVGQVKVKAFKDTGNGKSYCVLIESIDSNSDR